MKLPALSDEVRRVVDHVFLPPKLPQQADDDTEIALIDATLKALQELCLVSGAPPQALDNAVALLDNIKAINCFSDGRIDEPGLQDTLSSLPDGRTLAAKVSAQNAAILVSRQQNELVFETFELSPDNESVLTTQGRLVRTFPGLAVAISASLLKEADFQSTISNTLAKMCHQEAPGMQPQSQKAGSSHDEFRDTAKPHVVSELFMGVLKGFGTPCEVLAISKNTRDEVLWSAALAPWRRSPMWLLVRVALQLVISRSPDGSRTTYKEVMIFIMSHVLESALHLPTDVLYTMTTKIHRRLQKLTGVKASILSGSVETRINKILRHASDALAQRWGLSQQQDSRNLRLSSLATLNFESDTLVPLPALDAYIRAMRTRQCDSSSVRFIPSSQLSQQSLGGLPTLPTSNSKDAYYAAANLRQFEQWVEEHIHQWVASNAQADACQRLQELLCRYHILARSCYLGNPEATSVMVLTIFELWIACDEVAVRICPLLRDFDPGVSPSALQNLLLPFRDQMRRLSIVEEYLDRRQARTKSTDLLFTMNSSESFASKYFDGSDAHQILLQRIESAAHDARRSKQLEYQVLKANYCRLDGLYDRASHSFTTQVTDTWCDPPETKEVHDYDCQKCSYKAQRDALVIQVHEWSLPTCTLEAKAVVLELALPTWLSFWRDARFYLIQDVLKGARQKAYPSTRYILCQNDPHLTRQHFTGSTHQRINLLSQTKPMINTHYRSKKISTLSESEVCVPSGLQYKYYDTTSDVYLGAFEYTDTIPRACTYTMPCQFLQRFLFRPASAPDGPEPNTVIANLDACPENMALEEYKDLATLPLGRHIQWANVMLQLAMPSVDFKKPETALVFLQIINQVGPAGSSNYRDSHDFFRSDEKTSALLQHLEEALQRVKGNWESSQALYVFVAIAARTLSLSASLEVQKKCLTFLATARGIACDWYVTLKDKAHAAVDHTDRTAFIAKSVEAALICTLTYDVDDEHLKVILAGANNASLLVQTSIVVQEGELPQRPDHKSEQHLRLLDLRRKRVLYRIYTLNILHPLTTELDHAITVSWSGYVPQGTSWRIASTVADHWLTTDTLATSEAASMSVHYNILNGELLVDGVPLDQPPKSYRDCPLYSTLFGSATVEVMPSTTPGFRFSTKRLFGGCAVELGMSSDGNLIVRATDDAFGSTYETIPSRLVKDEYPHSFVHDHVQWVGAATSAEARHVQFRPVREPWISSSPAVWTLSQQLDGTNWRLLKAGCSVIGISSPTSKRISHVLHPLAHKSLVHCILQPAGNSIALQVTIPTLRLGFGLAHGGDKLRSQEFRSMFVDADQSFGSLVGFSNKIVLKHLYRDERMVLLAESEKVTAFQHDGLTTVTIDKHSIRKVHAVHIDPVLGRLVDSGDLGCKLYLARLHALSSSCLVDPLTKMTGTEQALTILTSAAVRSFDQLSQEHVNMLVEIAKLSPGRRYYPLHERVMQTIDWNDNISFLSQHGHFVTAVESLLLQAEQAAIFFPYSRLEVPTLNITDRHLLQRDNVRSAAFRAPGFGAEDHKIRVDKQYTARDRGLLTERATRAAEMSSLMIRSFVGLSEPPLVSGSLWKEMSAFNIIHGAQLAIDADSIRYDAKLFDYKTGHCDVVQRLPALHRWLGNPLNSQRHKFSVMMWLSTMASAPNSNVPMLQTVAMFSRFTTLATVFPPTIPSFHPTEGNVCNLSTMSSLVGQYSRLQSSCPEQNLRRQQNERAGAYNNRRYCQWRNAKDSAIQALVSGLVTQWPCEVPNVPVVPSTYIIVDDAMTAVRRSFKTWYNNRLLDQYLTSLEQTVSTLAVQNIPACIDLTVSPPAQPAVLGYVPEQDLFHLPSPKMSESSINDLSSHVVDFSAASDYLNEVQTIKDDLAVVIPQRLIPQKIQSEMSGKSPLLTSVVKKLQDLTSGLRYETQYVANLDDSLKALTSLSDGGAVSVNVTETILASHLDSCIKHVKKVYGALLDSVSLSSSSGGARATFLGPRVSPMLFLRQLSRTRWCHLPKRWKPCIVQYALALAALQRAERLTKLFKTEDDLIKELQNPGHQNWDPMDYPESLLMEVESGMLIRNVQEQVAAQMRDPPNNANAVMQLNMGEGKSSVIVPIVAAALANGQQLVRVVVAKPQSKQMAQMLVSKLGGLLNRRVYYMPISRSLKLGKAAVVAISAMLHDCKSTGGILLIQPEHILSFQLMAPECYILGKEDVGKELMATQDFFDRHTRDLVDESDENFSVRFELIYTMGMQRLIEYSPDRWLVLQQVLHLVRLIASELAQELPQDLLEFHPGVLGSFPRVRILRPKAGELLLQRLAKHICDNGLDGLPLSRQPEEIRLAVHLYITKFDLDTTEISAVEDSPLWTKNTKLTLLLIRGIIACGVLKFVLSQKRWRVNYGLATRTPPTRLAVPFRAKDSPSPRSEFSHPDVVITLTSLSYYYGGLCDDDLFTAMGQLMDSDQADIEYQTWVRDAPDLPVAFRQLQGINLKDRPSCTSVVFPALRFAKSVIDYFLSHVVFPKEMKEFPKKLSASGWDIGKRKDLPVTGFSGTNDSRDLLPIDVLQLDHPDQKHTNALVLEYILQPENGVVLMDSTKQTVSDAESLLAVAMSLTPPVQVILDVGAQILELNNLEVSKTWLKKHDPTKEAAVFVNDDDELCVVDREGRVDVLQTSPYFTRLEACLIFLDESHTRGIDLRLPSHYRAAVTLGAGLTKDRLVQACMRLRKLGRGQTVVFCISQEIQAKIMECMANAKSSDITVADVIIWSISETHAEIRHSMPLWAVQGTRFVRQDKMWRQLRLDGQTTLTRNHAERFQEDEAQSLSDRFGPRQVQIQPSLLHSASDPDLQRVIKRCQLFDGLQFNSSTLQEEQERELSPEIEQERQIQKAPPAEPALHRLHKDVLNFATRGQYIGKSEAYVPAFQALSDTSAAEGFCVQKLYSDQLLVTTDFKTVIPTSRTAFDPDTFQRPVQWLLTSRLQGSSVVDRIMIISPFEANQLHNVMEGSNAATLHVYKPRCNSGYASIDQLDFHTISAIISPPKVPRLLAIQLGLFAGQLYISSHADYQMICEFLGLCYTKHTNGHNWNVAADGFILSDEQGRRGGSSGLEQSPINFFKILMSKIRRNGDRISKTHMGDLLDGKLLQDLDFEG